MNAETFWRLFAGTGEPVYYLLYRRFGAGREPMGKCDEGTGALPRPWD